MAPRPEPERASAELERKPAAVEGAARGTAASAALLVHKLERECATAAALSSMATEGSSAADRASAEPSNCSAVKAVFTCSVVASQDVAWPVPVVSMASQQV